MDSKLFHCSSPLVRATLGALGAEPQGKAERDALEYDAIFFLDIHTDFTFFSMIRVWIFQIFAFYYKNNDLFRDVCFLHSLVSGSPDELTHSPLRKTRLKALHIPI